MKSILSIILSAVLVQIFLGVSITRAQNSTVTVIEWQPTQSSIAVGEISGNILIHNTSDGSLTTTLIGHANAVIDLAWSPDESYLASASLDGTVKVWNTSSWSLQVTLTGHTGGAGIVIWDGNTRLISIAADADPQRNNLYVWETSTWQKVSMHLVGSAVTGALNSDNNQLTLGMLGGTVSTHDLSAFVIIQELVPLDRLPITALAWTSDGNYLASGSVLGSVYILNMSNPVYTSPVYANDSGDGQDIRASMVIDLQFSTDGSVLSSISADGTVRAWNRATSALVVDTRVDSALEWGIAGAFSPDGTRLAYSDASNTIEIVPSPLASPRVTDSLLALYTFDEGGGSSVQDTSGVGAPLNLNIPDPSRVTWGAGTLRIDSTTLISSPGPASKIIDAVRASNALSVELWITPSYAVQPLATGPARIVAISQDTSYGNLVVGQGQDLGLADDIYTLRLRTSSTNEQGRPGLQSADGAAVPALTHLVYTRDAAGSVQVYVNGTLATTGTRMGSMSAWNTSYPLALGNESTLNRGWLGTYHLVAFYSRALSATEVAQNYAAGAD